jgi:hypothetical protein
MKKDFLSRISFCDVPYVLRFAISPFLRSFLSSFFWRVFVTSWGKIETTDRPEVLCPPKSRCETYTEAEAEVLKIQMSNATRTNWWARRVPTVREGDRANVLRSDPLYVQKVTMVIIFFCAFRFCLFDLFPNMPARPCQKTNGRGATGGDSLLGQAPWCCNGRIRRPGNGVVAHPWLQAHQLLVLGYSSHDSGSNVRQKDDRGGNL